MQSYLQDKNIPTSTARIVFKSRTRMTSYWNNFKGKIVRKNCPICCDESYLDDQPHSFQCTEVKKQVEVKHDFNQIFGQNVDHELAKTIERIEEVRKSIMNVL